MRPRVVALLMGCVGALLGPAAAFAADPPTPPPPTAPAAVAPVITDGPEVSGTAQVGQTLTARARWTGTPDPDVDWVWRRCTGQKGGCDNIKGARDARYSPTAADVGFVLRVRLTVTNAAGKVQTHSSFTAQVAAAPSAARPSPRPAPSPTPAPAPAPAAPAPPPFELAPAPAAGAAPAAPHLLNPFPTVRIKGWLTARGARITLLSVRAPRAAQIAVSCRGEGCPRRTLKRKGGGVKRLRPFERQLRAGTRLNFKVTRHGTIGKWTAIVIRRGAAPQRTDGCLDSDTRKQVTCPA